MNYFKLLVLEKQAEKFREIMKNFTMILLERQQKTAEMSKSTQ